MAIDALRKESRRSSVDLSAAALLTPSGSYDHEAAAVREALRALPKIEAIALVLRLQERVTHAQIAVVLGISERWVKSVLARGRLHFMAAYQGIGEGK